MKKMKKKILLTLSVIYLPLFLFAQIYKAEAYYKNYAFQDAIKKYKRVIKKNPTDGESLFYLANSYRLIGKTVEAENWFSQAVRYNNRLDCKLYYAQMLLSNGKYSKAKEWFLLYSNDLTEEREIENIETIISYCENMENKMLPRRQITITKAPFNSEKLDFSPAYYNQNIIFATNGFEVTGEKNDPWTAAKFVDLYMVTVDSFGNASEPERMSGAINSVYHEGPATYDAKNEVLYFTRNDYLDKKRGYDNEDNTRLRIYSIDNINGNWQNIQSLPFNSSLYSCCHPAISTDGKILVFSSDMPGGEGGMDLYISRRSGTDWTVPKNLGKQINTKGNELFPFLHHSGNLYFASDYIAGYGGYDIFEAWYDETDKQWINPHNMGMPINTGKDDFGLIIDDNLNSGYLTSNRSGELDDIYRFIFEKDKYKDDDKDELYVCGVVVNKKYQTPLANVDIRIINKCDGSEMKLTTNEHGEFRRPIKEKCDYVVKASKAKFEDGFELFTTIDTTYTTECIDVFIPLTFIETFIPDSLTTNIKIKEGMIIELFHVYFDFDKYNIRADATNDLDTLYALMLEYPEMKGELGAHTDCRGTFKYNVNLSNNRAKSAKQYLVDRGISPDRLTYKGYGETKLKNRCADGVECSEKEHQRNRRVEFKVTYFKGTVKSKELDYFLNNDSLPQNNEQ